MTSVKLPLIVRLDQAGQQPNQHLPQHSFLALGKCLLLVFFAFISTVMSQFLSKALRRAEVFLEQVDESVAQAGRRLVVEGATGAVNEDDEQTLSDDEKAPSSYRRASSIPTAESRTRASVNYGEEQTTYSQTPEADDNANKNNNNAEADGWDDEIVIDDSFLPPSSIPGKPPVQTELPSASDPTGEVQKREPNMPAKTEHVIADDKKSTVEDQPGYSVTNVGDDYPKLKPKQKEQDVPSAAVQNTPSGDRMTEDVKGQSSPSSMTSVTGSKKEPTIQSNAHSQVSQLNQSSSRYSLTAKPSPSTLPRNAPVAAIPNADSEFVNALQEENTDLRKELENVESELDASRRDRAKLVKNLKRMKEIVSEMDETLRDKSLEARELNDEILNLKEQLSALQTQQKQSETRGKGELEAVQKELGAEIAVLKSKLASQTERGEILDEENERLKDALLQGHEVDLATADGARQEASEAHRAYEAEAKAHHQTRQQAKEREEKLQEEAALATVSLASAQRKVEECTVATSQAKAGQRAAESKLVTVTQARDAAFARIEDLEEALRLFERNEGHEAPGQREAKAMQDTVSDLENALEAKNVELTRLEGEVEAMRVKLRRDGHSPRTPGSSAAAAAGRANENVDVELKMRHMADSALRKQAQLEVLRSENRALQHQLTTERKRTREAQAMAAAASSSRQSIRGGFRGILDSGEDDRTERMYGLRDGPLARFRTPRNWPKPLARVITGLDKFSAQVLAFLRKEPLLRIALIFYVVLLHMLMYGVLHWHVGAVSGSVDNTHGRIASAKGGIVNEPASK